jgi:hypothetical protein
VVVGGRVVALFGGKVVVVVVGGRVVALFGGKVVVVVVGGRVVVVVGGKVVVVVVATGSNSPLTPACAAVSVFPVAKQSPREYVGTFPVVQPGWVLAFISMILLEAVESASEFVFSTAKRRAEVVPA